MTTEIEQSVDTLRRQVALAEAIERAVDGQAGGMAKLLVGRLRAASCTSEGARAVDALKRELRDFNGSTKRWRPKP